MNRNLKASFKHVGLYVWDLDRMADFYQNWFGLVVTDGGNGSSGRGIFLSGDPGEHHQLVFVVGREPGSRTTVNQLSFLVEDLATVKAYHQKALSEGTTITMSKSHGNAISLYILDPEGNQVEIYCHTPWYVAQPAGKPVNFDLPESEILQQVEDEVCSDSSFMPRELWVEKLKARMSD
jgi:catechol 2,3-dioxygenase